MSNWLIGSEIRTISNETVAQSKSIPRVQSKEELIINQEHLQILMRGSSHIQSVLIGIEYPNC